MYKLKNYIILITCSALILSLFIFGTSEHSDDQSVFNTFLEKYRIYALPKPKDNIHFSGELVPLENPDIWERYDKEILKNTYWQSNTLLLFKRAAKYMPVIEPILEEHNIPNDFKYLAIIESGLENVTSPAGAKGFWQIMKSTAKEFNLEVNSEVDERYNLEKSTIAACNYLNAAKEKFGSWTLAAAAYNMGRSGLQKQINVQKSTDYYNLRLNQETSRYIFRILALKEIMENPKKYGFSFRKKDLYKPISTYTLEVDTTIENWADFSHTHGINYKILKLHNPWLVDSHLTNTRKKKYQIKIPKENTYKINY